MEICRNNEIKIRELEKCDSDFNFMLKWLNNKSVSSYYGGIKEKNLDYIINKYGKKIEMEGIYPCIIEINETPVGYIQFYCINSDNYDISKEQFDLLASSEDKVIAIDLFIGEDDYRDKGFGNKILKLLINTIFEKYNADVIVIDPKTENIRAIKCYKKCGFKESFIAEKREDQDGIKYDNLVMKIEKNEGGSGDLFYKDLV